MLLGRLNTRGAKSATFRDVNRADRFRVTLELTPKIQAGEDLLRAVRERRDARVEARLRKKLGLLRLDEHDRQRQLR